jgi:hypothetical protein
MQKEEGELLARPAATSESGDASSSSSTEIASRAPSSVHFSEKVNALQSEDVPLPRTKCIVLKQSSSMELCNALQRHKPAVRPTSTPPAADISKSAVSWQEFVKDVKQLQVCGTHQHTHTHTHCTYHYALCTIR